MRCTPAIVSSGAWLRRLRYGGWGGGGWTSSILMVTLDPCQRPTAGVYASMACPISHTDYIHTGRTLFNCISSPAPPLAGYQLALLLTTNVSPVSYHISVPIHSCFSCPCGTPTLMSDTLQTSFAGDAPMLKCRQDVGSGIMTFLTNPAPFDHPIPLRDITRFWEVLPSSSSRFSLLV